jgi:hypothetical protein
LNNPVDQRALVPNCTETKFGYIDTDAGNEFDDQYAISLVLGSPDRFDLEGIVAAHFGERGGRTGKLRRKTS